MSSFFFFKQKTAYEMRISDWSSDVCSSDLLFIDSTCIKVHRTAGGANGGGLGQRYRPDTRRQKLQGSRRLRLEGSPLCADYNPENVPDMKVAKACIAAMPPSAEPVSDKGYDSNDLRA